MVKGQIVYKDKEDRQELQPELVSIMKEEVGKARERRMPIIRAFEAVAQRSGLKSTTIRNYYYRYIHAHESFGKAEAIDAKSDVSFEGDIGKPFTDEETRALMRTMLIAQAAGESVRGCANRLSGGDKRVLIRLQNKYRSIIARDPEYVEDLIIQIKSEGIACFNPYTRRNVSSTANLYKTNSDPSEGGLLEWLGQFISNMKDIKVASVNDFVKGLRDLSSLAAGHTSVVADISNYEREIQDLNNRMILLEASIDKERKEMRRVNTSLRSLMDVNKRFLSMPDSDKLSGLKDYVEQLHTYIQE